MKTTFLDYYKIILDKVSFDSNLFKKEYQKAVGQLTESEIEDLDRWLGRRGIHGRATDMKKSEKVLHLQMPQHSHYVG
jgi:hypothetical protein